MTDSVYVNGIEFLASHGYTAAERKLERRFRCHIEIQHDLSAPAKSDRIQDTIDYRAVCATIVEIGTTRTFKLLESLAGAIADAILDLYPDVELVVTVEKLAPPCAGAPEVSGVKLRRKR